MSSSKLADEPRLRATIRRYLRSGVRSTAEVVRYLCHRGVSPERAGRLVSDYHARGWLDDRAGIRLVAEQWARQGYASAAIRVKLAAKGFDARIIDETIARVVPSSDDEARARTMLAKRAPRLADRSARARLARTLAARGFEPDVIERLLGQSSDPDDA